METQPQGQKRIFLFSLQRDINKAKLLEVLSEITVDLVDVVVSVEHANSTRNRGFAFAEYGSPESALAAFETLKGNAVKFDGKAVQVDWPCEDDQVMASVKSVFVRGVGPDEPDEALHRLFSRFGPISSVRRTRSDISFVHFEQREHAVAAVKECHGTQRPENGATLVVMLARPPRPRASSQAPLLLQAYAPEFMTPVPVQYVMGPNGVFPVPMFAMQFKPPSPGSPPSSYVNSPYLAPQLVLASSSDMGLQYHGPPSPLSLSDVPIMISPESPRSMPGSPTGMMSYQVPVSPRSRRASPTLAPIHHQGYNNKTHTCVYFKYGQCRDGDKCQFAHKDATSPTLDVPVGGAHNQQQFLPYAGVPAFVSY